MFSTSSRACIKRCTFFDKIEELLLQHYFLYEKSSKKCCELDEVEASLKLCLDEGEMEG